MKRPVLLGILIIAVTVGHTASGEGPAEAPRMITRQEALKAALRNNFDIRLAKIDYLAAFTDIKYSNAIFDTFLTGGTSYSEDRRKPLSVFGSQRAQGNTYRGGVSKKLPFGTDLVASFSDNRAWSDSVYVVNNPSHTTESSVGFRQAVGKNFFGYVDRRTISVTQLAVENADLAAKDRIEASLADTEKAYLGWMFSVESLEIIKDMLGKAEELYSSAKKNFEIGRLERADLYASEANVLSRKSEVVAAENRVKRSAEELKFRMDMDTRSEIATNEKLAYLPVRVKLEEALKKAFSSRRDQMEAARIVKMMEMTVEMRANEMWPEMDLVGTMAVNGIDSSVDEAFSSMASKNNSYYYGGVEFSYPFENSLAESRLERAGYEREAAIIALAMTERRIITEVGNAWREYATLENVLSSIMEAADITSRKLDEEERMFLAGRSSTKNLIDYQREVLSARHEVARAVMELEKARIDLERSMNTLFDKHKESL
ncbi:MAG: TolC family protein [Candidatus Omnitrophica bacterium]|nr:TolC family protein [Candidatus Omnitrophota bacterium]